MIIEIHEPELEALIAERMATGRFQSVEDALLSALKAPLEPEPQAAETPQSKAPKQSLGDFLLESPLRGLDIDFERIRDYPRPLDL